MTTTTAPTAEAEATLALADKFLDAVNTRNEEALIETMAEDCRYELRVAPTPVVSGHDGIRIALRRSTPPGRTTTSSPTTSTSTARCSLRNGR